MGKGVIMRKALTDDQIVGVVEHAEAGHSRAEAAKSLGIPEGTIGYIVRRLRTQGIAVNFPRSGSNNAWGKALERLKNGNG